VCRICTATIPWQYARATSSAKTARHPKNMAADIYIYCKEVINFHQSIFGIAAERWARNLTSRVQISADPKFQFFLSFLLATLKIWLQIAKPFKKNV
jgi:hypothetical protein